MLCYRCGSHVPDTSETCPTCGQKHDAASRQAAGGFSRKRAEDAPYKPGAVVALRYAIREVIGAGPLGFVFKAHDQDMDVEVALKVVHPRLVQAPEERAQFSQVLRTGRRLTHPHLLRVYEEGLDGDCPYFTMQLLGGMTLRKLMDARAARAQRFTPKELEGLLAQVASALDDAHRLGPHADLKPENILILPDMAKVTDYGLGLAIPRLPFIQAQRHARADVYLAPEYVSGGEFDTRMDIYALAVIVGELLTGLTPVDGVPPELQQKLPELPPGLEALYRRALNANPLARPKTAGEFLKEYSAILRGQAPRPAEAPAPPPVAAPPPAAPPVADPARPRSRPGGSGAHGQLSASARAGDNKPPPPVPTDQLPAVRAPQAPPKPGAPVDATQPLDEASLRSIVSQENDVPPDATQPMDAAMLAAIMSAPPAPASAPPARAPIGVAAPASPRAAKKASKAPLLLAVLAVAGLVTGSAVGYFVLRGKQQPPAQQEVTATPPPAPAQPEPPEEKAVTPPAPVAQAAPAAGKACPAGMRHIPGGAFPMGTSSDERTKGFDERPLSTEEVASFCMDEFEFPNVPDSAPRVDVSWTEAKAACTRVGKRLCTEGEWEKACKGPDHTRFPYGNIFDPNACNTEDSFGDDRTLAHSGQFAKCRSGYGVADLSGNVAEWTATAYTSTADMTQKGGAFDRPDYAARCSARKNGAPGDRAPTVGFRCCSDVRP